MGFEFGYEKGLSFDWLACSNFRARRYGQRWD